MSAATMAVGARLRDLPSSRLTILACLPTRVGSRGFDDNPAPRCGGSSKSSAISSAGNSSRSRTNLCSGEEAIAWPMNLCIEP